VIAASAFGLKAELEVIAKDPFEQDILKVSVKTASSVDYPLQRLTRRMTAKHGYLPNEIKKEDLQILSKPLKGRMFYFARGTDHAACIMMLAKTSGQRRVGIRHIGFF